MRKLLSIATATLVSGSVFAQGHIYVGQHLNYQYWDEDRFVNNLDQESVQVGLNLGYQLSSISAIELSVQTAVRNSGENDADFAELNYFTFFREMDNGFRPYMVTGVGFSSQDNRETTLDSETLTVGVGGGVSKFLAENIELRADVRIRSGLANGATGRIVEPGYNFTLNYHLGNNAPARPVQAPVAVAPARVEAPVAPRAPAPRPAPQPELVDVTVELDVLFATNSAEISNADVAEFRRMATALRENSSANLVIEGHTDSAGSAEYNESLSQRRADAVRQELIDAYNAPANQIRSVGYGEARPIADNATAAGRAQNRRVIGVLTYQTQR